MNNRLGYYDVGGTLFHNAYEALIYGSKTNTDVHWNFNTDVFSKCDWTTPIETSLDELYKIRALQLRNNYDYLILNFSGGRDSTNILLTFLNNGIFLDEIVMNFPFSAESNFNKEDTSSDNNFSEIKFAAREILNKHKNKIHPNTIIRNQDLAEPNLKFFEHDDWFELIPMQVAATVASRSASYLGDSKIIDLAMKGKKVANITGIDKPRIVYFNNSYYYSFTDTPLHSINLPTTSDNKEIVQNYVCPELFYWTPDLPEIVIKQAQVVMKAVEFDKALRDNIQGPHSTQNMFLREQMLCKYIYSDDEVVWQTEKPVNKLVRKLDSWFWDTASIKAKSNYWATIAQLRKDIASKYFTGGDILNGKKPHFSGEYFLKRAIND